MDSLDESNLSNYIPSKPVTLNETTPSDARLAGPPGYDTTDDDDYDSDDDYAPIPRINTQPTYKLKSPGDNLTVDDIAEEEKRRFISDQSMTTAYNYQMAGASSEDTKTLSKETQNMSFIAGDPVSVTRQVRHLYNRVKLLEEEVATQHNRQIFLFSIISIYFATKGFTWMFK